MDPTKQRIAIAEACGWRSSHDGRYCTASLDAPVPTVFDPLTDLNAMHEAEKTLPPDRWGDYVSMLEWSMGIDRKSEDWKTRKMIHATASQRAEAFLRTLNLWKD